MEHLFQEGKTFNLKKLIDYSKQAIVSKQILKAQSGNITLFSFDKGQMLSEHTAPFDVMIHLLEGEAEICIDGRANKTEEGETIILPANVPHAVKANEKFKMLLVMLKE